MFILAIDQNICTVPVNVPTRPIFSPVHLFPTGFFGMASGLNLFHCLFPVISGITHTIPAEPFLISLIGRIVFLLTVTQCVTCFAFIELLWLTFMYFVQLLPCYESLRTLTKQMACEAFCIMYQCSV